MVKISRDERMILEANGVRFKDGGISKNSSHHNTSWYLCESVFNLSKLDDIRKTNLASDRKKLEKYNDENF